MQPPVRKKGVLLFSSTSFASYGILKSSMAIYLMKRGEISCDTCKREIAKIFCSDLVMRDLEKHPVTITCTECNNINMLSPVESTKEK